MPNPLLSSINRATKDDREIAVLVGRYMGTSANPRGRILSVYRRGRKAMAGALRNDGNRSFEAYGVLRNMRREIAAIVADGIDAAVTVGQESAQVQLDSYAANGIDYRPARLFPDKAEMANSVVAAFDQQAQAVQTLLATNANAEAIIGDGSRLGVLQPAPVQREGARWLATAVSSGLIWYIINPITTAPTPLPFKRQAIAGIDERTTNCCLNVHGSIVELNQDFRLTGTPRYANYMRNPPFHDCCHTSIALYLPEFDDGYTDMMRRAAILERRMRGEDGYSPPHPTNAFSRIE